MDDSISDFPSGDTAPGKTPHRAQTHGARQRWGFAKVEEIAGRVIPASIKSDPEARGVIHDLIQALRQEKRGRQRAETAADTDELTGMPNLRSFRKTVAEKIDVLRDPTHTSSAKPRDPKLSIVLVDLNFLKFFNDGTEYGGNHEVGNEVLKYVAKKLQEHFRRTKAGNDLIAARVGGDEFGIVVYGAGREQITQYMEKVAQDIRQSAPHYFEEKGIVMPRFKGAEVPVSVSFGCHEVTQEELRETDNDTVAQKAWANASIAEAEHKLEVKKSLRETLPDFVRAAEEVRRRAASAESPATPPR